VIRTLAEQAAYRFGYAINLCMGAEEACDFGKAPIAGYEPLAMSKHAPLKCRP
jgi:hypothetical protein